MADFTVSGIIDVDASRGIRGIQKFKRELKGLLGELKAVDKEIKKLDGRKVDIKLDADRAKKEAADFRRDLAEINKQKAEAKLDFETKQAELKLKKFESQLGMIDDRAAQLKVDIEAKNALREAAQLKREIESITKSSAAIKTEMKGNEKVLREAKMLRNEVEAALKPDPEVNVKYDDKGLKKFKKDIAGVIGGAGGGLGMSALIAGIVSLISLLGPLGTAAVAAGGGLAGGFTLAGTAAASFGVLAIPAIKDIVSLLKGELKPQTETLRIMKRRFDELKDSYMGWANQLKPSIFITFNNALSSALTLLGYIGPIALEVGDALETMSAKTSKALKTDDWKNFFGYIERNAKGTTEGILEFFGNFITGFANLTVALDPLTKMIGRGFLNMSRDFKEWSQTLEDNEGFQNFLSYMQEMGPKVWDALTALSTALVNILINLAPLGERLLDFITNVSEMYNHLTETNPELASLATSVAAIGIALVPLISGFAGLIGPLMEIVPLIGGLAAGAGPAAGGMTGVGGAAAGAAGGVGALAGGLIALVAVLAAIGGILALTIDTGERYDAMWDSLKETWEAIKKVASDIWGDMKKLWELFKDSGAIKGFQVWIQMLSDTFRKFLPVLRPVAFILGGTLLVALGLLGAALVAVITPIWALMTATEWVVKKVYEFFKWLYDVLVGHSIIPDLINGIIEWFAKLPGALVGIVVGLVTTLVEKFRNLKNRIQEIIKVLPGWLRDKFDQAKEWVTNKVTAMGTAVAQKFVNMRDKIKNVVTSIPGWLRDKFNQAKDWVLQKLGALKDGATEKFNAIINAAKNILGRAKNAVTGAFKGAGSWLLDIGRDIMDGLVQGIEDGVGWVRDKLGEVTDMIPDWKGPAEKDKVLLTDNGKLIMKGLVKGISLGESDLYRKLADITNAIDVGGTTGVTAADARSVQSAGMYGGGGVGITNNYYNVEAKVPVGTNMAQAGREIAQAIEAYKKAGGRSDASAVGA